MYTTYQEHLRDKVFSAFAEVPVQFLHLPPGGSVNELIYDAAETARTDKPVYLAIWRVEESAKPKLIAPAGLLLPLSGKHNIVSIMDSLMTVEFDNIEHEIMAFKAIPNYPGVVFETPEMYLICTEKTRLDQQGGINKLVEGQKVEIFSGDGKTLVGEGEYVEMVTVYAVQTDKGLLSTTTPEERPPESRVPGGGRIIEIPNNPKFKMADGTFRYGCQVWWKPK